MPTTDTEPLPGIDRNRASRWLGEALGMREPLSFRRIGLGQSNLTYLVEDRGNRRAILRRPPLGELARGAHDMAREHRILSALARTPVPTPRPLAMGREATIDGAAAYLMEHVDGFVVDSADAARALDPPARTRAGSASVEALAAVHAVDVDDCGLGDLSARDGYAERQLRGWGRQWEATRTRDLPIIDRIAGRLKESIPPQREVALVHGDYNLANLIVSATGEVRAVLDWELSTLGDPVADLGTLLTYWPDTPEQAIPERDAVALMPGFSRREQLVAAYAAAAPDRDLTGLGFWHALATWKLAIIYEGVVRRRLANPQNGVSPPEMLRRSAEHLAELAGSLAGL
ncbi:MAG: phosphotransferase family protein [Solirubrobacteraceae bacterium]